MLGHFEAILHALSLNNPFVMTPETQQNELLIRWESPLEGWALLNMDGASKGNPRVTSGGGVLRGHRGEWIKGFTANFGKCTSIRVELRVTLHGLEMA